MRWKAAPAVEDVRSEMRRGASEDLKTLHSEGMTPATCTLGSSGKGQFKCASSEQGPVSDIINLSFSALRAALPLVSCMHTHHSTMCMHVHGRAA